SDCPPPPLTRSADPPHRLRARWRGVETSRLDKSTNARRAPQRAPARSTARPRASRAQGISRAAAAEQFPQTCFASDRIVLQSSLTLVVVRDEPVQQANAIARAPALIDFALRCSHRGSRDIEVRPRRIV